MHRFPFALPRSPYCALFLLGHAGGKLRHWAERTFLCPYLQQEPGVGCGLGTGWSTSGMLIADVLAGTAFSC